MKNIVKFWNTLLNYFFTNKTTIKSDNEALCRINNDGKLELNGNLILRCDLHLPGVEIIVNGKIYSGRNMLDDLLEKARYGICTEKITANEVILAWVRLKSLETLFGPVDEITAEPMNADLITATNPTFN